jgi:hypothetical protein
MTGWLDGWSVVFDLDGTLVDTAPDLLNALNHVLDHAGLETVDLQTVAGMIGHGAKAMIRKGMSHQGLTPSEPDLDVLFDRFLVYYSEHIAIGSRPFDQAPEILDGLAADGAILSVCTNKKQDLSDKLLDALALHRDLPPSSAPTVCRPKSRTETISCGPSMPPGAIPPAPSWLVTAAQTKGQPGMPDCPSYLYHLAMKRSQWKRLGQMPSSRTIPSCLRRSRA